MSIDTKTGDIRITLTIPAGFSRDVVIDKNKARQLLIPEQIVQLAEDPVTRSSLKSQPTVPSESLGVRPSRHRMSTRF